MNLLRFFFLTCVLMPLVLAETPKIKIGVFKKIENCTKRAKKGDVVHVHYKGTLENGDEFDSSYSRQSPFTFSLGLGQVIKGWDQGILGMCVGEKRRLTVPPELAYGKTGAGNSIPPDSTLTFDVELMKIDPKIEL